MDRPFLLRPEYADQQLRALRKGAHPALVEFERRFIRRMAKKYGVPMFAHNMVRSSAEQAALYVQGVSNARAGESPHNFGCAVDVVHGVKAWGLARESWAMIGHIGEELARQMGLKLVWGGHWHDPYDPAHWELADWRRLAGGFPFEGG